ncbi:MAG: DNA-binding response regulator [Fluviicola sp. XM-24bin1]|nr:MAG: DNA-binding response regulator [Fluviicola sp. XM-24bin1]
MIQVAIAEDHTVFRELLSDSLQKKKDMEVIIGASNGSDLIAQMRTNLPDIVLLDLHMPIMDGTAALEIIRSEFPKVHVIILSLQYSDIHVRKYMKLGARGYLCKDVEFEKVVNAIRDVDSMGYYFYDKVSPDLIAELVEDKTIAPESKGRPPEELTTRKIEIIQQLFEQLTNQEIAENLNISVRTVHNHRINITRKTGSKNVVGVMLYAIKHGLTPVK